MRLSRSRRLVATALTAIAAVTLPSYGHAEDKLLTEAVQFNGTILYLSTEVPGLIFGAVRNGEMALAGFGKIADGSEKVPDGDTMFRIASVSKVFCGSVLSSLAIDGKVQLTDRLQDRLGWDVTLPEKDGRALRLIDLVAQASGLPREVPVAEAPPSDPFSTNTKEAQIAALKDNPLLFAPGTAVLYSNFGYDLLGAALANVSGKPYAEVLRERVLDPLGMKDTVFNPRPEDEPRLMQGHNFDGSAMPIVPTSTAMECAGGLYSTADDLLRWMNWHVDNKPSAADAEFRLVNHAAFLYRDGLASVVGLDDGGPMDAMGLGWVIMLPNEHRPLILQKSGGLQGMFLYVAIAPTRGVGAFFVMNEFNAAGFMAGVKTTNDLVAEIAPR
ncbi:MAG: D-alanyl-D-alanine-carboxypeptidase/endopeptidase AmpH [Mesorhizobium sp.]|nr:MAG: D-alanyl-D-alanine-carboxypeptidase/endopeptidase AmpH [Mesorhizobium sp.]